MVNAFHKVVLTRSIDQVRELQSELEKLGIQTILFPCIEIHKYRSDEIQEKYFQKLDEFDVLLLSSSNAVEAFFDLVDKALIPETLQLAAVGSVTAKAIEALGLRVDFVPDLASGKNLAVLMIQKGIRNKRILYPRAKEYHPDLKRILIESGAIVKDFALYENKQPYYSKNDLEKILAKGKDAIWVFTSSSALSHCDALLGKSFSRERKILCSGPSSENLAKQLGFQYIYVTKDPSRNALIDFFREDAAIKPH